MYHVYISDNITNYQFYEIGSCIESLLTCMIKHPPTTADIISKEYTINHPSSWQTP